jgi:hypothetical protein
VVAPRFAAALPEALTAGSDSAGGLMAEADLTAASALALAIRISGMAMEFPVP